MEAKHADETKPECDKSAIAIPSTVTNEAEANKAILQAAEKFLTSTDQLRTSADTKIQTYLNSVQALLTTVISEIKDKPDFTKQETNDISVADEEMIMSFAKAAFYDQDYDLAEVLLNYLKIARNSKAAQHLLEAVVHFNAKQKKETVANDVIKKERFMKCYVLALHMTFENRLKAAEFITIVARYSYWGSDSLLNEIGNKLYGADATELTKKTNQLERRFLLRNGEINYEEFKYNTYMSLAVRAHLAGKNKIAKDFMLEAQKVIGVHPIRF